MKRSAFAVLAPRSSAPAKGFTLLEVLISVILLALAMVAVAGLQVLGLRGNAEGEDRGVAASLIVGRVHELSAYSYTHSTGDNSISDALFTFASGTNCETREVNRFGLTREELAGQSGVTADIVSQEAYLYTIRTCITDSTEPSDHKLLSVEVSWNDRLTTITGERRDMNLTNFPLMPKFN